MTKEKITLTERLSAFLKYMALQWQITDPIQILQKCIKDEEWFKGVVLSTAIFEGVGIRMLSNYFKDQITPEKFEHIRSMEQIIVLLYVSKIIDQPTYSKMIEVNKFRNTLVHYNPYTPQLLQPKEAKEIIKKAMSCLKALIEKWPKPGAIALEFIKE